MVKAQFDLLTVKLGLFFVYFDRFAIKVGARSEVRGTRATFQSFEGRNRGMQKIEGFS